MKRITVEETASGPIVYEEEWNGESAAINRKVILSCTVIHPPGETCSWAKERRVIER